MSKKTIHRIIVTAFVLVFMFSATGFANESREDQMVIPDLLIGKPLGFFALGIGTLTYVVTLPISMPFGWHEKAAEALVKKPYRFTFQRGLGEDLDR